MTLPRLLQRLLPTRRRGPSRGDIHIVGQRLFSDEGYQRFLRSNAQYADSGMADYLFSIGGRDAQPAQVFDKLRWGGQLVIITHNLRRMQSVLAQFRTREEFIVEGSPQTISTPRFRLNMAWLKRTIYFCTVRKVHLDWADVVTDRHSYHVQLVPRAGAAHGCVVLKQVPSYETVARRLIRRFPEIGQARAEQGARKLVDKVFPLFLTREAAFLKILQRDLPEKYRNRVPTVLQLEHDHRGLVQKMYLNWLRLGGEPLSLLDFAHQSTELLHLLHETAGIIHMDLRLDNIVITENGVGFVDFGSAARVGEDFSQSPMLTTLFSEMLSTSQIQRDLRQLQEKGRVTSSLFIDAYQKIDKAVDLFYLTLQLCNPHGNPDLKGLVRLDQGTPQATSLARLTRHVLRPRNPDHPDFRSARDVLDGIRNIEAAVGAA
ncbi:MAG: serine/threonine-protein kinase [Phycisphaeraceae bacterium]